MLGSGCSVISLLSWQPGLPSHPSASLLSPGNVKCSARAKMHGTMPAGPPKCGVTLKPKISALAD